MSSPTNNVNANADIDTTTTTLLELGEIVSDLSLTPNKPTCPSASESTSTPTSTPMLMSKSPSSPSPERKEGKTAFTTAPPLPPCTTATATGTASSTATPPRVMSPREFSQPYMMSRIQSSPSVMDFSPKTRTETITVTTFSPRPIVDSDGEGPRTLKVPVLHLNHTNQTQHTHTPIMRNTRNANEDVSGNVSRLSVPETRGMDQQHLQQCIRPRHSSCVWTNQTGRTNVNVNNMNMNMNGSASSARPISPPSWSCHRATSVPTGTMELSSVSAPPPPPPAPLVTRTNQTSVTPSPHKQNFNPYPEVEEQAPRYSSPLENRVPFDRNHHSFDSHNLRILPSEHALPQSNSPESQGAGTPQPRSPDSLYTPYQPTRESSLASFGVAATDDLDSIFLPVRTQDHFHSSRSIKASAFYRQCSTFSSNDGSSKDDDMYSSMDCSDSQSCMSIPSIRLGVRVYSSTQESVTTNEYEEEDDSHSIPSVLTHHSDASASGGIGSGLSSNSNIMNMNSGTGSGQKRRRRQKRDKQVYEWLKTLELDKDNNDYFAEAASSKFLTGKTTTSTPTFYSYNSDRNDKRFFSNDFTEQHNGPRPLSTRNHHNQLPPINKSQNRQVNSVGKEKSSNISSTSEVMGRNVSSYSTAGAGRSNGKKGGDARKVKTIKRSGIYH